MGRGPEADDVADECVFVENFRDVGEWVNALAGEPILLPGKLLRGGSIRTLPMLEPVQHPRTILNLQSNPDPAWDGVTNIHLPSPRQAGDVYETDDPEIRRWLRTIVGALAESGRPPVYVHCHSGRDRTGVVVAAILRALGVSEEIAALEYTVSDGVPGIETIRKSLRAIGDPALYFRGLALAQLRALLLT